MKKLLFLVIALLLVSPAMASANMLVNPGFEVSDENQGYMSGWTDDWGNNIFSTTDQPHSGLRAAANSWDGGKYQDVAITAGEQYQLTGFVYIPTGTTTTPWGSFIGIKWLRSNDSMVGIWEQGDFASMTRDQYNQGDSGFLTAPDGAVKARIRFGTWANDTLVGPVAPTDFDDFDFEAVPEPSSLMLLLTGITGIFGLGLKRKK